MSEKEPDQWPPGSGSSPSNPQSQSSKALEDTADLDARNAFTRREKWFVVALIALTALFSPFTANIYFPAIPTIARAFHKPIELINLTVTVYVVLQGISPMFWGTLSDNWGRRPIAASCLLILSLSCIGLALVPTSDYWLLLLLRCLQAAGGASTIAIGAGVISDISTPAERGGFYGFFSLGPMVGPALGPVVGGALTQGLGWRSIFWFLCIAVSVCLVVLILLFPETLISRRNSNSRLKVLYTPIIPVIGRKSKGCSSPDSAKPKKKLQNPFRLFAQYDILLPLVINATSFSVFFGVVTSLSTLFEEAYPFLDEFRIGLCFLAMGGGMAVGSTINGKMMDWRYDVEKRRFVAQLLNEDRENWNQHASNPNIDKLPEFPLERARLNVLPSMVVVLAGCCAGYGWCINSRVNIAVPLVLHVVMGYICMAVMNGTATLMIDLAPGQGSAVMACNNLIRCTFSAIIISVIQPIINGIGVGWTYVVLAGLTLTSLPLFVIELKFGPRKRRHRLSSSHVAEETTLAAADNGVPSEEKRLSYEHNKISETDPR